MRTPIIDDRTNNSKKLCDIEFGQHFILSTANEERLCRMKEAYHEKRRIILCIGAISGVFLVLLLI